MVQRYPPLIRLVHQDTCTVLLFLMVVYYVLACFHDYTLHIQCVSLDLASWILNGRCTKVHRILEMIHTITGKPKQERRRRCDDGDSVEF